MVQGNEWMEQPTVATASARAQRGGDRRHSEVPASITAHQADESERPQEPDVERHRHEHDRHHHQHARQDFDDQHVHSPSSYVPSKDIISFYDLYTTVP
jgi:hypothetical protein